MPQLKFKGIEKEKIKSSSTVMIDELQSLLQCPRDYFTLEVANSTFIWDGEECQGPAIIEVAWFDRGQELQDKSAEIITRNLKNAGVENCDIIFTLLKENSYYENGQHF